MQFSKVTSSVAMMLALSVTTGAGCAGGQYAEMTIVLDGMVAALGHVSEPSLINIVVYAPRPSGAPLPDVRFNDPGWDSAREERRITVWNGADRMSFNVAWPRGEIQTLRAQAVVATGACGAERVVLAEGAQQGFTWRGQGEPAVTVMMRAVSREIRSEPLGGACP